jgi:cyclopropane fatty-acyl-phospholipid synthase-like methyltransferase
MKSNDEQFTNGINTIYCPFCENKGDEKHLFNISYSKNESDDFTYSLVKCKKCKLIYVKNFFEIKENKFSNNKKFTNKYFQKKINKIQADFIKSTIEKGDLLQIGCGKGDILSLLKNENLNVIGIDTNYEVVSSKEKLINEIYHYDFQSFFHYENEFDAIVFFDSLSVSQNPDLDIDKAIRLVRDDGFIFIEEKIFLSKMDDLFGKYYSEYNDSGRTYYYNPGLLKKIFKQKGFSLIKWKKFYPAGYKNLIDSFSIFFKEKLKIKNSFFRALLLIPTYIVSPFLNIIFYLKNYFKYGVFGTRFLCVFSKTKNK